MDSGNVVHVSDPAGPDLGIAAARTKELAHQLPRSARAQRRTGQEVRTECAGRRRPHSRFRIAGTLGAWGWDSRSPRAAAHRLEHVARAARREGIRSRRRTLSPSRGRQTGPSPRFDSGADHRTNSSAHHSKGSTHEVSHRPCPAGADGCWSSRRKCIRDDSRSHHRPAGPGCHWAGARFRIPLGRSSC
jgi:hypothetical protein